MRKIFGERKYFGGEEKVDKEVEICAIKGGGSDA